MESSGKISLTKVTSNGSTSAPARGTRRSSSSSVGERQAEQPAKDSQESLGLKNRTSQSSMESDVSEAARLSKIMHNQWHFVISTNSEKIRKFSIFWVF